MVSGIIYRYFNILMIRYYRYIGLAIAAATCLSNTAPAIAESDPSIAPVNQCPIDWSSLRTTELPKHIITADTVSQTNMTLPSLWWASEQFPRKLVTNWMANTQDKQIYVLVNPQYWNGMDYVERYRLIDRFGQTATSYGYTSLQFCTSQKTNLGHYKCDRANCAIAIETIGQEGLGVTR
jgi:hypothetical protein